jgi:hypothetical protein
MDPTQSLINQVFGGDTQRFEQALDEGLHETVRWQDVLACSTVLPEYEAVVLHLIENRLGWLPVGSSRLRYEPYLRGLLKSYRSGGMTPEEFAAQTDEQLKLIRNDEMQFNTMPDYDHRIYQSYDTYLSQQREAVRQRVTRLLGYEPALQHSVVAEIWLREITAEDSFHLPEEPTAVDWKALSLIRYREILLTHGRTAADASPIYLVSVAYPS